MSKRGFGSALAAMLALAFPAFAVAGPMTGNQLKELLQLEEKFRVDHVGSAASAGFAVGYVNGVAEALAGNIWCDRSDVTPGQMVALVSKYLKETPVKLDRPALGLIGLALAKAFPCEH